MKNTNCPAPVAAGCGAIDFLKNEPAKLLSKYEKRKALSYYLHVCADGTELAFATEPETVTSQWIKRCGVFEYATIRNIKWAAEYFPVRPRGGGWRQVAPFGGSSSTWRRSAPIDGAA
jgi:hypothetical protein